MAGYRDTLNLPRTDFPMKADLPRREPERLAWWEAQGFYRRLRTERAGAPVRLLHDGPPYSNGHLHMGTAANKIWKDAYVRFANLIGCDSPFLPGWDNHGMPIEMRVSREFRERKQHPDPITLRHRCREYAAHWVEVQRQEFRRLGVWGDWDRPYLTMDHGFEAAILEAFARLAAQGFVQRGQRSIHWCPTDRTALAEAEIEYDDVESPSIYVAFPLREDPHGALAGLEPVAAVAWTTTPWTLPANVGLMAHPAADYLVVEAGGRRFIVSEARLAAVAPELGWNEPRVVKRLKGRELIGSIFENPWRRPSRVVDGLPFVSLEDGTGLVHTAPGHGKEDFQVGQREGLEVLCPVDEGGRFTAGAEPFVGRSVLEVDGDIIERLRAAGVLLGSGRLRHSYPHCWRCKRPVIFRATDQWFLMVDHQGHRQRCLDLIDSAVRWDPGPSQNRIRESVRNRPDWCLSRQRSWGVGIPAVYCEACQQALLDSRVIARAVERTRDGGSDAWFEEPVERFLPPAFACSRCGSTGPFRKETDILDVWFDSGSTHFAVRRTFPGLDDLWTRAEREHGRVAYFEGPDQHRGWFNSSLMVSAGISGRAPYSDVLTHGWVLDEKGQAMHKSRGNVVSPQDLIHHYGADIVRWWALATDWRNDVRVGDEILSRVSEAYRKVRNTLRFLLGNVHDFDPTRALPPERLTRVDRLFLARLGSRLERMRQDFEASLFHRAADALLEVCTVDLSALFLDLAKDRLYTLEPDHPARRSAQTVLWNALHDLLIATSPILAYTAEEAWQCHPALLRESPSVHLARWPEAGTAPPDREEDWQLLMRVRDAVYGALEPLRAQKVLNTTSAGEVVLAVDPASARRLEPYLPELAAFLIVAGVEVRADGGADWRVEARRTSRQRCERCWNYRDDVGSAPTHADLCARCVTVMAARGG
jgi:isoleucyl-tRNA synthetase